MLSLTFLEMYECIHYRYTLSTTPLSWNDIKGELSLSVLLRCDPENIEDSDPFFIMVSKLFP